jgi:hypothetical protein
VSTAAAALKAIKRAVASGAWRADPHLWKQIAKRGLVIADVLAAIRTARGIRPHDMLPLTEEGESWRVQGRSLDGRTLGVGVELTTNERGDFVLLITAFEEDRR